MKKALVVGIDYYENGSSLYGCVNDANQIKAMLARHGDGTLNFDVKLQVATNPTSSITRKDLKTQIEELFEDKTEIALFYFSGHGDIQSTGGYLITSECQHGDDGLSMNELMQIANNSPSRSKIIVLDCCNSGIAGDLSPDENRAILSEGTTILTASSKDQYAIEKNGSGVFTALFVDALSGSAANLIGHITPGSVYAHIDQSLGPWEQRPIFKTNVTNFTTLRIVQPSISLKNLRRITDLFPVKGQEFQLDPTYEPYRSPGDSDKIPAPIDKHVADFKILQKYNRVNLLVPVNAPHMWHAAMESKSCKLTILGEFYWDLVKNERL